MCIRDRSRTFRYDWKGDQPPGVSWSDMILYKLHVRGFTMHSSSRVPHRGTFKALEAKIPYLKSLGINGIELMPMVDFADTKAKVPSAAQLPPTISERMQNSGRMDDLLALASMDGQDRIQMCIRDRGNIIQHFYAVNCFGNAIHDQNFIADFTVRFKVNIWIFTAGRSDIIQFDFFQGTFS